jgi:hypothetical protein
MMATFLAMVRSWRLTNCLSSVLALHRLELGIALHLFQQGPVLVVGRVVLQDVENEFFLDRLAHAVEAEGLESPIC